MELQQPERKIVQWKRFLVLLIIVAIALGAFLFIQWYKDPMRQYNKMMEELERPYREDTYGGKTPEETLRMYLDALKKGDLELAAKYRRIDAQERELELLKESSEKGFLESYIKNIEEAIAKNQTETNFRGDVTYYWYIVAEKDSPVLFQGEKVGDVIIKKGQRVKDGITLTKNEFINLWKIY